MVGNVGKLKEVCHMDNEFSVGRTDIGTSVGDYSFIASNGNVYSDSENINLHLDIHIYDGNDTARLYFDIYNEEKYSKVYDRIMSVREHLTNLLDEMTEVYMDYKINEAGALLNEEQEEAEDDK